MPIKSASLSTQKCKRMVSFKLRQMYKGDWVTVEEDWDEEAHGLERWSVEQVAQFEKDHNLRLPDELKVYLMEIGEGGTVIFVMMELT